MKCEEWIKVLEAEVEKKFDPATVDGFEDSAPEIKLGILSDMYDEEPLDIGISKERAYERLANMYSVQASWN